MVVRGSIYALNTNREVITSVLIFTGRPGETYGHMGDIRKYLKKKIHSCRMEIGVRVIIHKTKIVFGYKVFNNITFGFVGLLSLHPQRILSHYHNS